jgi:hypothetical protein
VTTHVLPRTEPEQAGPADRGQPEPVAVDLARAPIIWRAKYVIVGVSLLFGAATYQLSAYVPAAWSASSDVLVSSRAPAASTDAVSGTNDLAAQYAQLAGTAAVLAQAAEQAQVPSGVLARSTSAGTLANTNIVRITVTAGTADAASRGAAAVSVALITQARMLMAGATGADPVQLKLIDGLIGRAQDNVVSLTETLGTAPPQSARAAAANASLGNAEDQVLALTLKRIDLVTQARRDAAGEGVSLASLTPEPRAGQTAPKPLLYSLVGLAAIGVITTELAVARGRRRAGAFRHRPALIG